MPSQLVSSSGCCQPCDSDPVVVNIPGPQGAAGTNGTNGTNGIDSFTYTTAAFFVPALGASVVVPVDNTEFLPESVAGQFFVSIQGLGYMQVTSVDGLLLTLQNPAAGVLGIANAVPTTLIPSGSLITLAGAIGPTGAAGVSGGAPVGASYICRTADGTLTNETALDSLSSGYMKTAGSGGAGAVSTVATVPVGDISGTLPIAKGGTNLTTAPANKIPVGDGTTYLQKEIVGTAPIVVTNSAGNITLSAPSIVPFNYVTFTRRVTGLGAANAPNVSSTSASNPYSTSVYTTASYAGLDSASGFTASSGRFTVPYTGYYRIDAYFNLDAVSTTANVTVFLRKNGSDILVSTPFNVTNSGYHPISLTYIDQATALTDFYEVLVSTNHNLYVDQGSSFSVQRIQA
jgi:hypothetical protein